MSSESRDDAPAVDAVTSSSPAANLAPTLKTLASVGFFSSSRRERRELFEKATAAINASEASEFGDNFVKALCKLLPTVLTRFRDGASRHQARTFLGLLLKRNASVTSQTLVQSLWETFGHWKTLVPSTGNAKTAVAALKWTALVLKAIDVSTMKGPTGDRLIDLQSVLVTVALGCEHPRLVRSTKNILHKMWNTNKEISVAYAESLMKNVEQSQQLLVLASSYIGWQGSTSHLKPALDALVKLVIGNKVKCDPVIIKNIGPLLKRITHEDFKNTLLPSMQKAMLQNPEVILQSIGHIIASLSIDLSQYVMELQTSFGTNLHAKDDVVREDALFATAALARQMSDPEALEKLLKSTFDILEGSEGKLTVNDQKGSLLKAAGLASRNAVTGAALQSVCDTAFKRFCKVLESEVHEGTLLEALTNLSLWAGKISNEIPSQFVDWFPKAIALKTSTSTVRSAYIASLFSALKSDTLASAVPLIPTLLKTVENCAKQSSQVSTLSEGALAASCLARLSALESETEGKLEEFWKLVLDSSKSLFNNERFLLAASPSVLTSTVALAEKVLEKLPGMEKKRPWLRSVVVAMLSSSTETRRFARATAKRIEATGFDVAMALLEELNSHVWSDQILLTLSSPVKESGDAGNASVSAKFVVDALTDVSTCCKGDMPKALVMAKRLLNPCHQEMVHLVYPNLWRDLVKNKLGLAPESAVEKFDSAIEDLIAGNLVAPAIDSLVLVNPDKIVPELVNAFVRQICNTNISVSAEEYQIFLTPKGELFDKQVLEHIQNESDAKNIKRESKAYSYKEQLEEIALRKELEEKRRKEGKAEAPKLTPKQKEALNAQLEKEDKIRTIVAEVKSSVDPVLVLLARAVHTHPKPFAALVAKASAALFRGFRSPVCAKQCCDIFHGLRRSVFDREDESLSQVIASTIIQLKSPSYALPDVMTKTKLNACAISVVTKIGAATLTSAAENSDSACPLSTPAFNYAFPIIDFAVRKNMKSDSLVNLSCNIMNEHSQLRGAGEETSLCETDDLHPKYLPIGDMFRVLIEVVTKTEGRTQQVAVSTFVEVASAASGRTGCATVGNGDIGVLLGALQSDVEAVRDAGLRGLETVLPALPVRGEEIYEDVVRRIWVAQFDVVEENRKLATKLWQDGTFQKDANLCFRVIDDITHPVECVRSAGAEALAALLAEQVNDTKAILQVLLDTYREKLIMTKPVVDNLGRVVQEPMDHWEPRSGIAVALKKIAAFYDVEMVENVASFLVPTALDDRNAVVRGHCLDAAVTIVNLHGKETAEELLPVFEKFMEDSAKSSKYDNVRQSVVILMGSMAKHLDPNDPKVRPIMRQLIMALNTPSQQVQEAVAQCLPPLVPTIKDEAPEIVSKLITTLLGAKNSFGERKGAAYGIAGIVKGLGILSLKQLDIMGRLTEAIQDKKNPTHREGALFAFEMLCNMLGRLFEPYIVHILPHLLLCFGDPVEHVRQAADDTAKAVMSKLSAHGVKLVLPSLLNALEEDQWRTKSGSIELLGAMAFCAPKQLSSCLPSIVPKLIEVLGDSHHRVQEAGEQALKQIGSVIRNPEIQAIVPILLTALQDPAKKTGTCLQTLLDTKFVHFIDAPSLALIMPVVQRAFQDRSTETRKMAAQIIGNMYSLTDQKDLSPYLPGIIPGLKNSLLDPVPEVRTVSAKALGAMVRGLGEASFEELLPWLMSTLTSETSSVDRSGAAQGLAEVVGGLGVEKMHALMPDIIRTTERSDIAPHVKDGYIMMFIYMPAVFPDDFTPYIPQIISPVLRALADENEFVRETAYKAGQRLVTAYADTAITLLLPELEKGMFNDNWRIRHSSVQLLGDLLYKVLPGVSGKMTTETADDDDNFGTEQSQTVIIAVLGLERRNRVLAGLYMGRSDVALMVRQASLHVWKVIVSNTPKTLREILPTLFNLLLGCLASNSYDKRQVAARTLGDLVKKLGERVLPEIIPILERGLESEQPEKRQGVCVGLSEIMASTSRDMVLTFVDSLVPTVRKALCDDLPEVREAAAKSFDSLHNTVGSRALDDILPAMLKQLDDDKLHDNTLDGLRQVMAIKSRAVLPYLIPQLISKPVNTKALASLAPVAGEALHRHLVRILPALLQALSESHGTEEGEKIQEHAQAVVLSISDDESDQGVRNVLDELLSSCKSEDVGLKRGAITLLHAFCSETKADYSQYVSQLIRSFIFLFTEDDEVVLQQAWNALNAVTKNLDTNEMMAHVGDVRQAIRFALMDMKGSKDQLLPGFCLPKGIQPILPIFREGILNGPPELKEQAAMGLGEVINVTSATALKPSVVHITGPLIRILGDRFSHGVKVAVLDTLALLLAKAKDMLKPFFPQLQTTFLKALNDVNRAVRIKAGSALGYLITIHTRPDPIFNDLYNGIKSSDDAAVRDTYLHALRGCLEPSGGSISAPIRKQIVALLYSYLSHGDDSSRTGGAGCLGALCKWLPDEDLSRLMDDHLAPSDDAAVDWTLRHGRSTALFVALKLAPERIYTGGYSQKVEAIVRNYLLADRVPIAENGVRSICYLFQHCNATGAPLPPLLVTPFCKTMNHNSNDVKQLVAVVAAYLARSMQKNRLLPDELLKPLLPMLVNGTKEKNSAVKSCSESSLVCVLRMKDGKEGQAKCLALLDSGAKDALEDVITKVLQRAANQPQGKEEVIDNTLLV